MQCPRHHHSGADTRVDVVTHFPRRGEVFADPADALTPPDFPARFGGIGTDRGNAHRREARDTPSIRISPSRPSPTPPCPTGSAVTQICGRVEAGRHVRSPGGKARGSGHSSAAGPSVAYRVSSVRAASTPCTSLETDRFLCVRAPVCAREMTEMPRRLAPALGRLCCSAPANHLPAALLAAVAISVFWRRACRMTAIGLRARSREGKNIPRRAPPPAGDQNCTRRSAIRTAAPCRAPCLAV